MAVAITRPVSTRRVRPVTLRNSMGPGWCCAVSVLRTAALAAIHEKVAMSVAKCVRGPVGIILVGVLAAALTLATAGPAAAAGTVLFDQTFKDNTADGTGAVELPAPLAPATNAACLTATGNAATGVVRSCPTSTGPAPTVNDAPGSGALSLTPLQTSKVGGVFAATSVPTSAGL